VGRELQAVGKVGRRRKERMVRRKRARWRRRAPNRSRNYRGDRPPTDLARDPCPIPTALLSV
jgi:hypothetical protein